MRTAANESRVSVAAAVSVVIFSVILAAMPCAAQWNPPEVVTSERFSIFAAAGKKEAATLLRLAEDVHDDFTFLVGLPADTDLFGRRTADIFLLRDRAEYLLFADTILPLYRTEPEVLSFYRACPRTLNPEPPVCAAPESGPGARNWVVNATAHCLLAHYLGVEKHPPPWFTEGFAAWMETRFTGRTLFFRVAIGAYGGGGNDPVAIKQGGDLDWARVVESRVRAGRARRFDRLKGLRINHLGFHDLCQSWSLVAFLADEHPRPFRRWLTAMRRSPRLDRGGWERAFRRSFGWTDAQLNQRWDEWVRLTGAVRRLREKRRR